MKKKRFSEEQIIAVLKEAEAGAKVLDLCRKHGISDATFYNWKAKYAGMTVAELRRLRELEAENSNQADRCRPGARHLGAKGSSRSKVVSPQCKREAVGILTGERALGVTRACGLVGISRSLYRYQSRLPPALELRSRIAELAAVKRRYGYRRIQVLLRREGWSVNHKRTYRLYREQGLMVRKRKRKRIGVAERQPLPRPSGPNQSWSMDYVADGLIDGRKLRVLAIVDDYSRECLVLEVDTSLPGARVVVVLERLAELRGLPRSITVDHGPEFEGQALDAWAYKRVVRLAFIRAGKPVENAYVESFNGRFRDECLNEHWFLSMQHARSVIEAWRIEYNTERPHSSLNDQTPEQFRDAHASEENAFGSVSVKPKKPVSLTPDSTSIPY